jgi:hypothetical protein
MPVKSGRGATDAPAMSGLLDPVHVALIVVAICAWTVLMCLRVVGHAIDRAARRHSLMHECRHLRQDQAKRLQQLRANQLASSRRRSRRMPAPAAPTATDDVDILEVPADGAAAAEVVEPIDSAQAA